MKSCITLLILYFVRTYCYECPEPCECFANTLTVIIDCRQRNLTEIPLISGPDDESALIRVDLSGNWITELTDIAAANSSIKVNYLDLSGNRISRCQPDWAANIAESLVEMKLSRNNLSEIEVACATYRLTVLRKLDISENNITSLNFSQSLPSTLEVLIANELAVFRIPSHTFSSTPVLQILIMRQSEVEHIEEYAFTNTSAVINQLDLSYNNIDATSLGSFRNLTSLRQLKLTGNRITLQDDTTLFLEPYTLQTLDLSHNPLIYFSGSNLIDSINLEQLYLDNTELYELVFPVRLPLKILSISSNQLIEVPVGVERLELLERLNLMRNSVPSLPDILKNNSLLPQLREIDLSGNLLEYPPKKLFWSHPLIQRAVMSNGIMTGIGAYTFAYSNDITFIDLSHNQISFVGYQAFDGVRSLTEINLSYNQIANLFQDIFPVNPAGLMLNLYGNQFQCDCEANWLIDFSSNNEMVAPKCSHPIGPADLDSDSWTLTSVSEWPCFNSTTTSSPAITTAPISATSTISETTERSTLVSITELCLDECTCYLYPAYVIYDCQYNGWQALPTLPPLSESSKSILNFSYNKLTTLLNSSLSDGLKPFSVSLSHNHLKSIDSDWSGQASQTILYLDLSYNNLSPLSISASVENLINLIELDVTANGLLSLEPIRLPPLSLQTLSAANNLLTSIERLPLGEITSLKHLNLSNNMIKSIQPSSLELSSSSLEVIDLTSNEISNNVFESLKNCSGIMKLLVGSNHIEGLDVNDVSSFASNLKILNLTSNPINSNLESNTLSSLTSLEQLLADDGNISSISLPSGIPLKILSLSHNRLSTIPSG